MREENGYLVDRDSLYEGTQSYYKTKIVGYRVFTKDMMFDGLLNLSESGIINVDEESLIKL